MIAAIDEGFANSSAETISESEAAFIGSFMEQYRTFFRMAELLGFIVVLTIGLVAANTAAMSIRERRGEIAVMRSIGFPCAHDLVAAAGGVAADRTYRRNYRMRVGVSGAEGFFDRQHGRTAGGYPDAAGGVGARRWW